jgi:RimJ/RimL family protein N-acetyltransferase
MARQAAKQGFLITATAGDILAAEDRRKGEAIGYFGSGGWRKGRGHWILWQRRMEERERPLDIRDRGTGSKGCFLRKAGWADVDLLFSWANDKEVRKNSFSTEPVDYEGHLAWFGKKYQGKNSQIYIFCEGNGRENQEKGMLRLDFYEGTVEISYSIALGERQKGYGEKLILLAEDEVSHLAQKEGFQAITVKAYVKPENRASNCIFTKLGYEKHGMEYRKKVKAWS